MSMVWSVVFAVLDTERQAYMRVSSMAEDFGAFESVTFHNVRYYIIDSMLAQ